jgi:BirA family biotin operon repressor/biotin-[acetyl-CoA-carboxylase] ligase
VTPDPDAMPTAAPAFISRLERFGRVGSTNDVVRDWLSDGVDEVAVAVAEEQTAGRGRQGRTWSAPPGAALLLSVGFRPVWLAPERTWRLAAIVALAMADAAEAVAGLPEGTVGLKWPNDLVNASGDEDGSIEVRKLAGLLGETEGLGTSDPRAVVGIGVNAVWPRDAFPAELASSMTSLHDLSGGRAIDREALLEAFLDRLELEHGNLRAGRFDVDAWADRQVTTGRLVRLEGPDGVAEHVRATGVDGATGALLVEPLDRGSDYRERAMLVGEISHLRLPSAGAV